MRNTISSLVSDLLPEHPDAVWYLESIFSIMHTWDDLIDKDHPICDDNVNTAFTLALVGIASNPFYTRFAAELQPLLSVVILDWLAANEMEQDGAQLDLEIAFVTRSNYALLVLKVLQLCRGYAFAKSVAAVVRRTIHQEGFEAYCAALAKQKGA